MKPELAGKRAVFDLDKTLVEYTFEPAVLDFARSLGEMVGEEIDGQGLMREWHYIFNDFRPLLMVNPIVTTVTATVLMERHGLDQRSREGRELLYNLNRTVYNTPAAGMRLCPGALPAVRAAHANYPDSLIGTIAREGWTKRVKLARTELIEYFSNGNVHCFDVNYPKAGQWSEMLSKYGLLAEELYVVGDNLHADILPMLALGVPFGFWVNNGVLSEAEFARVEVPEGVIKLRVIGDLVEHF